MTSDRKTVAVIGGASCMFGFALRTMLQKDEDIDFLLTDYNKEAVERVVVDVSSPANVRCAFVDLRDAQLLRQTIRGADLLVHAAGPYYKNAHPVMEACLDERVPYLDFADDALAALDALDMDGRARAVGVPLFTGGGISPGLTNILARQVMNQLDIPEAVDIAWCTGDEGEHAVAVNGPAVVEHMIHMSAGQCHTWRDGKLIMIPAFRSSERINFSSPLGEYRVYELDHAEVVTVPHFIPNLKRVRCFGGLHPQPVNGIFRGVGNAVLGGRMTMEQATQFMMDILAGGKGSGRGWRAALGGVSAQLWRGEASVADAFAFLWNSVRNKHVPYQGGIYVSVTGIKAGRRVKFISRSTSAVSGSFWSSMGIATGLCIAAFTRMVLDRKEKDAGVLAPEAWVGPDQFYQVAARYGAPLKDSLVEAGEDLGPA